MLNLVVAVLHDSISHIIAVLSSTPTITILVLLSLIADIDFTIPQKFLSSRRQHLSYDGCLEIRGEIIRTVLCCTVY